MHPIHDHVPGFQFRHISLFRAFSIVMLSKKAINFLTITLINTDKQYLEEKATEKIRVRPQIFGKVGTSGQAAKVI